jgi:hypothetical protein
LVTRQTNCAEQAQGVVLAGITLQNVFENRGRAIRRPAVDGRALLPEQSVGEQHRSRGVARLIAQSPFQLGNPLLQALNGRRRCTGHPDCRRHPHRPDNTRRRGARDQRRDGGGHTANNHRCGNQPDFARTRFHRSLLSLLVARCSSLVARCS